MLKYLYSSVLCDSQKVNFDGASLSASYGAVTGGPRGKAARDTPSSLLEKEFREWSR